MNLGGGCVSPMIIEHEFLHAMGMLHEQEGEITDERQFFISLINLKFQQINVYDNCSKSNFTLHESRPDRDNFVIINWDNIQPAYHSQVWIAFQIRFLVIKI